MHHNDVKQTKMEIELQHIYRLLYEHEHLPPEGNASAFYTFSGAKFSRLSFVILFTIPNFKMSCPFWFRWAWIYYLFVYYKNIS